MGRVAIPMGGRGKEKTEEIKRGLWRAWVRWRDDEGKYHETTVNGRTEALALAALTERIDLARRERAAVAEKNDAMTFNAAAIDWLADLKTDDYDVRPSTIRQYRDTWKGTLSPVFGSMLVNEVTRADLQTGLKGLRRRDRKGVPILDAQGQTIRLTGKQARAVMMLLLGWAVDEGIREDGINPLAGTRRRGKKRKKGAAALGPRVLTPDEWTRLYDAAESSTHRQNATRHLPDVLVLLRWTGIRIGEALALRWEDVDLGGSVPTIRVNKTLIEVGPGLNTGDTKSTDVRDIALHEDVAQMMVTRKSHATGSPWVFANGRTERPVTTSNLRRRLRDLVRDTDLAWVHPHTFRHSLATAANKAFDTKAAADLLGHSDVAVTLAHYILKDDVLVLDPRSLFDNADDLETGSSAVGSA